MNPANPFERTVYAWFFGAFAFVLGTMIGSFLNVCIYRLPLGLSINEPRRSFCPHCRAPIAWYHNLPLVGWLWLRGRCANCRGPISVRYPLIELLTGVLFLLVWLRPQADAMAPFPILAFPYWIFVALLIVATFIDFDYLMIPDEITLGCVGAGLALSFAIPQLMDAESHLEGLLWSAIGAAAGYLTLWGVVEAGKLALGKKRIVLPQTEDFTWTRHGGDAELVIGADKDQWSEFFDRPATDQLVLQCEQLALAGKQYENVTLRCFYDRAVLADKTYPLDTLDAFSGRLREFVIPREAMGFGDVKLIAGIGAFLGWKAVFFSIAAASCVGSVIGVGLMLLGPKARSVKIPFGPYLSLGALLWLFAGPGLVQWYLQLFRAHD
jgi:leader peptidase (prepilin peptidase)/N-methyltransferase